MCGFATVALVITAIFIAAGSYGIYSMVKGSRDASPSRLALSRLLSLEVTPVIIPDSVMVLNEVNSLARLETASYSFQDVLRSERNGDTLFGVFGESLIFVAYGEVVAGVDLSQLEDEDVQVTGPSSVMIHLPASEIFFTNLDNDRSYVADRDVGILTSADAQLETKVRQLAESRMKEAALGSGILDLSQRNAEEFMITFLENFGFEEIIFTDETPPPAPTYVQEIPKGHTLSTPTP